MGQTEQRDNGLGSDGRKRPTGPNKHEVFFGHGLSTHKNQMFTVAIVPSDDRTVNVGVAVCNKKDQFNKKIGRMVSHGRALKCPVLQFSDGDTTTIEGMLEYKMRVKDYVARNLPDIKEKIYSQRGRK